MREIESDVRRHMRAVILDAQLIGLQNIEVPVNARNVLQ
jgi:hypothetical protein